jgi:AcrR family transcriptional regulator
VADPKKTRGRQAQRRRPGQLPAGRHGLDRDYVAENQRERILAAVAQAAATLGYANMSVEDIVKTAGVSRRTFYDHFANKEATFLAAYDALSERLLGELATAYAGADSFVEGIQDCLEMLLEFVAAEPAGAHLCVAEILAAGPEALERHDATMRSLATLLATAAAREATALATPPLTAETVVGGIHAVISARLLRDELDTLPDLLPGFTYVALLPYLGTERARAEHERLERRRGRIRRAATAG